MTGQFLIGGSREDNRSDPSTDAVTIAAILREALDLYPPLSGRRVLRSFAGVRTAGLALKNASGLVRCLMELGGNDPLIVMPDADLDRAAEVAIAHRFEIAGQSCAAVKRLYLHDAIRETMIERIAARVAEVTTGDPADAATVMGTVIDEPAATEVERRVKLAVADGARIVAGGSRRATPPPCSVRRRGGVMPGPARTCPGPPRRATSFATGAGSCASAMTGWHAFLRRMADRRPRSFSGGDFNRLDGALRVLRGHARDALRLDGAGLAETGLAF